MQVRAKKSAKPPAVCCALIADFLHFLFFLGVSLYAMCSFALSFQRYSNEPACQRVYNELEDEEEEDEDGGGFGAYYYGGVGSGDES